MSLPALQALREHHPEARITLLARPWVADIYKREAFCDEVIQYEAPRGPQGFRAKWMIASILSGHSFDCAILLPNSFESALLVRLAANPGADRLSSGRPGLAAHALDSLCQNAARSRSTSGSTISNSCEDLA